MHGMYKSGIEIEVSCIVPARPLNNNFTIYSPNRFDDLVGGSLYDKNGPSQFSFHERTRLISQQMISASWLWVLNQSHLITSQYSHLRNTNQSKDSIPTNLHTGVGSMDAWHIRYEFHDLYSRHQPMDRILIDIIDPLPSDLKPYVR